VLEQQILVVLQLEDVEDLFEGQVDVAAGGWLILGSAGGEGAFLAGVAFDGGSGLLDHVMVDSLPLLLLPVMH
jgi:hypothetical protein